MSGNYNTDLPQTAQRSGRGNWIHSDGDRILGYLHCCTEIPTEWTANQEVAFALRQLRSSKIKRAKKDRFNMSLGANLMLHECLSFLPELGASIGRKVGPLPGLAFARSVEVWLLA